MPERTAARDLIAALCTRFEPFAGAAEKQDGDGPLSWSGYGAQRERAAHRTGVDESVVCGRGRVGESDAVLIVFEFGYLGGSVGQAAGNRIVSAFERARELGLPVLSLVASGGSRVQEGILALAELHRIARACLLTRQARIPHVAVLRDPTTGGVWATLAAGADIVLATPQAGVAFGGSRVRTEAGVAFTAEGKHAAGQVDQIVDESDLPRVLATVLTLLHPQRRDVAAEPADVPSPLGEPDLPRTGWEAVERARSPLRPRAGAYLDRYFDVRFELSGDRAGGTDHGMLCGFGAHEGRTVAFAAQTGTANTPAGFRAAARLLRLADQWGIPALTLVDTPGADAGADSEQQGIGPAIADLFTAMAQARVPITTLVIGEGGSGGALALTAPDRAWITRDAYFAVISPESVAAILKRAPEDVPELANRARLRPQDLLELGFVRGIV
jgi:acyl-CoA carboxylase subunit beta